LLTTFDVLPQLACQQKGICPCDTRSPEGQTNTGIETLAESDCRQFDGGLLDDLLFEDLAFELPFDSSLDGI